MNSEFIIFYKLKRMLRMKMKYYWRNVNKYLKNNLKSGKTFGKNKPSKLMCVFFVHTCLYFDTVHLFPKPKCLYLKINFEILIYTDTFLAFKFKIILVRIYPTEIQFFLLIIIQFISCNSILILFLYCSWSKLYFIKIW